MPDDVRVLTVLRPADFPEVTVDLHAHNEPVRAGLRRLATRLPGPDAALRAHLATIELPYGVIQVRLGAGALSVTPDLDGYVASAARAVLADPRGTGS